MANQSGHFCLHFSGDEHDFRLGDWKWIAVQPYSVPFRCLYSRNVENLLMAGKHISVTQGKRMGLGWGHSVVYQPNWNSFQGRVVFDPWIACVATLGWRG